MKAVKKHEGQKTDTRLIVLSDEKETSLGLKPQLMTSVLNTAHKRPGMIQKVVSKKSEKSDPISELNVSIASMV